MPEITMCSGQECPIKKTCYRFTAKPSHHMQSYFVGTPYDHDKQDCDYYWSVINKKEQEMD